MSARLVVLGADDGQRQVWCDKLRAFGWTVTDTNDVQSAIDLAFKHKPHVIVIAAELPDAGGYHFIRAMRSAVEHDVKIVGIARGELSPELSTAGFDVIVTEPVDFVALQRSIELGDDRDERLPTMRMPSLKPE